MNIEEYFKVCNRFADWHTLRYVISLEWIDPYLISGARILDLGDRSAFSDVLKKFYGAQIKTGIVPDLRYQFPFPDNRFDLVLCMEVLEHIHDRGDSRIDIFTASGIKNIVAESFRVLRSGGHLFLTTPNVCCYNSIWRILRGKHPFSYQPHFRELALEDIMAYLKQADFEIERHEILNIWKGHGVPKDIVRKIDELSASLDLEISRGDCIFIMACKA